MGCSCLNRPAKVLWLCSLLTLWSGPGDFDMKGLFRTAEIDVDCFVLSLSPSKLEGIIGLLHRNYNCSTDLKLNVYIEKKICGAASHLQRTTLESVNSFHPNSIFFMSEDRVPRKCDMSWKNEILHSENADGVLF